MLRTTRTREVLSGRQFEVIDAGDLLIARRLVSVRSPSGTNVAAVAKTSRSKACELMVSVLDIGKFE